MLIPIITGDWMGPINPFKETKPYTLHKEFLKKFGKRRLFKTSFLMYVFGDSIDLQNFYRIFKSTRHKIFFEWQVLSHRLPKQRRFFK